jgi:16S rRNA (adenine1518-N6/adenine1519-N6)-dimethyltransferase
MPAPKVDSAVIRLDIREKPPVEVDEKMFFSVVKAAFSQRRKVISNSLSSGLKMSKDEINGILERAGVPANARAEKLSLEDFAKIANEVSK